MEEDLQLHINGKVYNLPNVDQGRSLLSILRDDLDFTGAHYGCGEGQCGACTVLLDGKPVRSCITPVGSVGKLHPVQEAFLEADALQCGYCTPGMVLSAVALLRKHPSPTDQEIVDAMQGNICRCGTYRRIIHAIRLAATGSRRTER
jgi:aerobic-type carbon monoxide dehydrogenase small subunit (CoxS/CutS family)